MMYEKERFELDRKRKLRYVQVYESLNQKINDGEYPLNSRLPSENELAELMGVSRMTLRQALQFLQDDGIIKNIKGKGSYIIGSSSNQPIGLETSMNPVLCCLHTAIDEIEMDVHLEPSTNYANLILKKNTTVVAFIDRWYKAKGEAVAYSFSTMPIETITTFELDLKNLDGLKKFVEEDIYKKLIKSSIKLQLSKLGSVSSYKYKLSNTSSFYLLQEEIYLKDNHVALHTKHYLPIDDSTIEIHALPKR